MSLLELADHPLHHTHIPATSRDQPRVILEEGYISHMTAMPSVCVAQGLKELNKVVIIFCKHLNLAILTTVNVLTRLSLISAGLVSVTVN